MGSQSIGFDIIITLVFVFVSFQLLLPVNSFIPFDRRTSSLFGAVLCMIIYYFSPISDGENVGSAVDFSVLIILTAVMIINFVILKQPWLARQVQKMQSIIRSDVDRGFYLVSVVSLLASPVILNDGLCLMLVAPVLDAFITSSSTDDLEEGIDMSVSTHSTPSFASSDPFFFMLTIACSANIGSTTTFAGNPQNIIVAQYLSKFMSGGVFFSLTFFPAMISWLLTITLINRLRKKAAKGLPLATGMFAGFMPVFESSNNGSSSSNGGDNSSGIELLSQPTSIKDNSQKEDDLDDADGASPLWQTIPNSPLHITDEEEHNQPNNSHTPKSAKSAKSDKSSKNGFHTLLTSAHSAASYSPSSHTNSTTAAVVVEPLAGIYLVMPAILLLIILEFVGVIPLTGLFASVSLGLVVVLLLWYYVKVVVRYYCCRNSNRMNNSDSSLVTNHDSIKTNNSGNENNENENESSNEDSNPLLTPKQPTPAQARELIISHALDPLYLELDYNLLIIFIGLFIVSGAFLKTGLPKEIWSLCAGSKPFQTASSIIVLSIYTIIASQLVGNVPVVFLAKEEVQHLDKKAQIFGWLILSFVSTIAGNLTLVGSAANIIVVEKAARHTKRPVMITAWAHFAICGGVTVVSIVAGVIVLYVETMLFV